MTNASMPQIKLNDGFVMPALGFGTFPLKGEAGVGITQAALKTGYRLLDSAFNYENEGMLGQAIRKSGLDRDALFISSKLPGRHHLYKEALETVSESLYRAGLEYFDLYLIHWPNPRVGLYPDAWRALIEARERGMVRSIGVCNFLPEHIQFLIDKSGVVPAVNQVELHPYFPQVAQQAWHDAHGIVTQSWNPLGRTRILLGEGLLKKIAARLRKTVPQVVLRWHIQRGAVPLPTSSTVKQQAENLAVFDFTLSDKDMEAISTLERSDGRLKDQDPAEYEEF